MEKENKNIDKACENTCKKWEDEIKSNTNKFYAKEPRKGDDVINEGNFIKDELMPFGKAIYPFNKGKLQAVITQCEYCRKIWVCLYFDNESETWIYRADQKGLEEMHVEYLSRQKGVEI